MKFFLISDNIDTAMGMRLSGVTGVVVHEQEEIISALDKAMQNKDTGIVLITQKALSLCREQVFRYKLLQKTPLIVEIPDRHGDGNISDSISEYVKSAIGMSI